MKVCTRCGEEKSTEDFYPWKKAKDGRYVYCRPCAAALRLESIRRDPEHNAKRRARRKANPEQTRREYKDTQLRAKYGITLADYEAMLEAQGFACLICAVPHVEESRQRLAVDHDHLTGEVRGLLCTACNAGLGAFRDDPDTLTKAIEYLVARPSLRAVV